MYEIKALWYRVDGDVEEIDYVVGLPHLRAILKCNRVEYIECVAGFRMWYDDEFLLECTPEAYIRNFNATASTFVQNMAINLGAYNQENPFRLFGHCLLTRYDEFKDVYVNHDLHKNLWNGCFYDREF